MASREGFQKNRKHFAILALIVSSLPAPVTGVKGIRSYGVCRVSPGRAVSTSPLRLTKPTVNKKYNCCCAMLRNAFDKVFQLARCLSGPRLFSPFTSFWISSPSSFALRCGLAVRPPFHFAADQKCVICFSTALCHAVLVQFGSVDAEQLRLPLAPSNHSDILCAFVPLHLTPIFGYQIPMPF